MPKFAATLIAGFLAITLAAGAGVQADQNPRGAVASLDLLKRASDPNPALKSYTASATLSATLHSIVPVSQTFNGTAYYLKPKSKITFDNVPPPLAKFKDLASSTPTYEQAMTEYNITPQMDDGTASTYALVPKKSDARVTKVIVSVDDRSALIVRSVWSYVDGGTLTFDQSYQTVSGFHVPERDIITARFPSYSVDGTLQFSQYQPNAKVDPSIFDNNS